MTDATDISQLLKQRKLTRAVAELFARDLRAYLKTLAPVFNPRSIFGEYIHGGSKSATKTAAKAFENLKSSYEKIHKTKPFNLRKQFDTPIPLLGASPEITAYTYRYSARSENGEKDVVVTSPLKWILSYEGFGPNHLRELLTSTSDANGPKLQQTVLHNLLLCTTLENKPGAAALLGGLRFPLSVEEHQDFGPLPLIVLASPLATSLPPDNIIIDSTEISGSSDFEEVLDPNQLDTLADPLRDKIHEVLASQGIA